MRLVVCDDVVKASRWVADYIQNTILKNVATRGKAVLGLPTGGSIKHTYALLVEKHVQNTLSFQAVTTFNMDEYIGLLSDNPNSYHAFMQKHLFSHVDIPIENVHIPNGMADDIEKECHEYEQSIVAAGGIDLFVGGVGADGHLAFNEPGSSLQSRTREKTLMHDTRVKNSRFFSSIDEVPRTAITVGIQTILDAREVLIIATGESKARAIHHLVEGSINTMWTSSMVQMHPHALVVCDEDATVELKVGTVRYFEELEHSSDTHT